MKRLKIYSAGKLLLWMGLIWVLAACSAGNPSPVPGSPAPTSPPVENTPALTPESSPTSSTLDATQPSSNPDMTQPASKATEFPSVLDRKDTITPEEAAINKLASRLGVSSNEITVVSAGDWTTDPIPCELEVSGSKVNQLLLSGEHRLLTLALKNKTYEVWVFRSVAGLPMAFPCSNPSS